MKGAAQITATRTEYHEGPLPHPDILAGYDIICPGAADRILAMSEKQAAHRQSIEAKVIGINGRNSLAGIISGVVVSLAAIGCGTLLIYKGLNVQGFVLSGGSIVGLVSVFIYGTSSNRKERESRRNQ